MKKKQVTVVAILSNTTENPLLDAWSLKTNAIRRHRSGIPKGPIETFPCVLIFSSVALLVSISKRWLYVTGTQITPSHCVDLDLFPGKRGTIQSPAPTSSSGLLMGRVKLESNQTQKRCWEIRSCKIVMENMSKFPEEKKKPVCIRLKRIYFSRLLRSFGTGGHK